MNADPSSRYLLSWKGRTSGPFTLPAIREQLAAGDISRMHQLQVNGEWMLLDEFLSPHEHAERVARREREAPPLAEPEPRAAEFLIPSEEEPPPLPLSSLLPADARRPIHTPAPVAPIFAALPEREPPNRSRLWIGLAAIGGLLLLATLIGMAALVFGRPSQSVAPREPRLEERLLPEYQRLFAAHQQEIFKSVHPIGDATRVVVHDVTINSWKRGRESNVLPDVRQLTVRLTLYWRDPLEKNGYTKLNLVYDGESERFATREILATNGRTNADAQSALNSVLATFPKPVL